MYTRRALLKSAAAAGLSASFPRWASSQRPDQAQWKEIIPPYLEQLARVDGGYAWEDQERSHLAMTYAVVGCYHLLGLKAPRPEAAAEFVRTHHPAQLKKLERDRHSYEYQQMQTLAWLGASVEGFRAQVLGWKESPPYTERYEKHRYPILQAELSVFPCRALLGLPIAELPPAWVPYLESRRRANGTFNNTPAADGSEGHVTNTWWGLQALQLLGRATENAEALVRWLQACQRSSGGFTYQPEPAFAATETLEYTWAALQCIRVLGAAPRDRAAAITYLHSLAHEEGGFGERPGWERNPFATFRALEALAALGALEAAPGSPLRQRSAPVKRSLPEGLRVYSIQVEAHGRGSPAEAVDLAGALGIHLWGAKNAEPRWLARAQAVADARQVPVRFFVANEEYDTFVDVPGMGTYSHTSDLVAPAGVDFGPSLAKKGDIPWPEFRQRRLDPLQQAGGRLIWQFGENEELVRLYLDDSVDRGGYAALSTFHFGNPDFINSEPFLQRWRGQIPFVALQDAHGAEPWWFADMTTGFRTVFLAREPTWEGWLEALRNNWTVAIRHDAASSQQTWMHSGSREVLEFVRQHESAWRWWDSATIQRPMVSLVALKPKDEFEVARPEHGVSLRIRCAFENTTDGQPKAPLTEFLELTLDGQTVTPQPVIKHAEKGGALVDHYHVLALPEIAAGRHSATVEVRSLTAPTVVSRTVLFDV